VGVGLVREDRLRGGEVSGSWVVWMVCGDLVGGVSSSWNSMGRVVDGNG